MILLDTNVVSEPLRPAPDARVSSGSTPRHWKRCSYRPSPLPNCAPAWHCCAAGKRRAGLQENLKTRVLPLFAGRVLSFDLNCAQAYAKLMAKARASGLAVASTDGYIAAIAAANGLAVATRDTGPFEAAAAAVINLWLG